MWSGRLTGKFYRNCFEWESKLQSFLALLAWLVLCYYFEPWMFPAAFLLVFLKLYVVRLLAGPSAVPWDEVVESDIDDEEEDDKEKVGCYQKLLIVDGTRFFAGGEEKS